MPYIKKDNGRREALQRQETALNAGELNYQIFHYIKHNYITSDKRIIFDKVITYVRNFLGTNPNYQRYNDITGCLLRCGLELQRRYKEIPEEILFILIDILETFNDEINKYEDTKIETNGDVG